VLDLQQLSDQSLGMADTGYTLASLDVFDHALMLTDEVRSLLAVLAPWLAQQQPFLLVRSHRCKPGHAECRAALRSALCQLEKHACGQLGTIQNNVLQCT
jgi:hypothetical protein